MPERNRGDLDDVPEEVREHMTFHPAMTIDEVLGVALEATQVTPATARRETTEGRLPQTAAAPPRVQPRSGRRADRRRVSSVQRMSTITASQEQQVVDQVPKQLYISGVWRDGARHVRGRGSLDRPALCEVADASVEDAKSALDAAVDAFGRSPRGAPRPRRDPAPRVRADRRARDDLALLMTLEMGKSIAESRAEIAYASEFFRWFSEEAVRVHGRYAVAANGAGRVLTMQQPVGPCLFITPWNFPLAMGTRKIGPAIAAGCTMIVKPAGQTPLSMLALAKILEEAGLPGGVLNLFTASPARRPRR